MKTAGHVLAVAIVSVVALAAAYFSEICRILLFGWIAFLGRTIPRATVNLVRRDQRLRDAGAARRPGPLLRPLACSAPRRRARRRAAAVAVALDASARRRRHAHVRRRLRLHRPGPASRLDASSAGPMYHSRVYGSDWPHADAIPQATRRRTSQGSSASAFTTTSRPHGEFPAGATYSKSGKPLHSWATQILPYLGLYPHG